VDKAELLARIESGRAEWERVLVQIGEGNMTQPIDDGGWSVKDIIAHLMATERWTAAQIAAARRGTPPTNQEQYGEDDVPPGFDTPDTDARNAAMQVHYRDVPLSTIVNQARHAFEQLVAVVQDAPEEFLCDPDAIPWGGRSALDVLPWQTYRHYQQHLPALRAWLERVEGPDV
jgi:hypothetical protein